jgi:hypothetical protein
MALANQSMAAAARRARARGAIAYNSPRAAEIVCSARRSVVTRIRDDCAVTRVIDHFQRRTHLL